FTYPPICSCCLRASKATGWPTPRPSPMACRSSARPPARSRRRYQPRRACSWRPMTPRRSRAHFSGSLRIGTRGSAPPAPPAPPPRRPRRQVSIVERTGCPLRPRLGKPCMNDFSAEWLALREPYDLAARNAVVLDTVANAFLGQIAISVVDLACGAGATLRAVGPHLPPRQSWRLVDNSLSLLARAFTPGHPPHVTVPTTPVVLARALELALDGPLDLVTTSALLDLVSREWLDRLVVEVAARRLPFYAALTYDGRAVAAPPERFDVELLAGFNLHQRTDKGF